MLNNTMPKKSLDPDSVLKNISSIHSKDSEVFSKILIDCFWLIRTGDVAKAQEILISSEAYCQALTIGGLLPYFDFTTYDYSKDSLIPSVMTTIEKIIACENFEKDEDFYGEMGNCNIELYISTCWSLSKKSKITSEKGIYGSLCGNYEAMLEMCEGDIYDHFWALMRMLYVFQLRQKLRETNENYHTVEAFDTDESAEYGLPVNIPNNWPSSFEGVLRIIQQKYSYLFENSYTKLQFHCIAQVILGK